MLILAVYFWRVSDRLTSNPDAAGGVGVKMVQTLTPAPVSSWTLLELPNSLIKQTAVKYKCIFTFNTRAMFFFFFLKPLKIWKCMLLGDPDYMQTIWRSGPSCSVAKGISRISLSGASAPHPREQRDNRTDGGRALSVHLAECIERPFLAGLPLTRRFKTTFLQSSVSVFMSYSKCSWSLYFFPKP